MLNSKKIISSLLLFVITLFAAPAFAQTYWGAAYINPETGIAGGSSDAATEDEAERIALGSCANKHGGDGKKCRHLVTFYNGCAAILWSPVNKTYGSGVDGVGTHNAIARGYDECKSRGGKDCEIVLEFCTTRILY